MESTGQVCWLLSAGEVGHLAERPSSLPVQLLLRPSHVCSVGIRLGNKAPENADPPAATNTVSNEVFSHWLRSPMSASASVKGKAG